MQPSFLQSFDTSRSAFLLALFAILATNALTPYMASNGDNASYIVLAESMAQGKGYTNTIYPGEPPETQYPPLLPVLLIPIISVLGKNYLIMKLIPLIFGVLGLAAMYRLIKELAGQDVAWIATLLTAPNANYIFFGSSVLTETIYVFLSAWVLIILRRIEKDDEDRIGLLLLAAVLITLSFYARTIGASLAVAACGYLFLRKRYKASILIGVFIGLLLLPWALRSIHVQNSYFYQLTEKSAGETDTGSFIVLYRLIQNIPRYAGKVMGDLIGGPAIGRLSPYNAVKVAGSLVLSGIFLFGYLRNLKKGLTIESAYLLVYLGILAVWPYHDSRFLLPILPLMFYYMIQGLQHLPLNKDVLKQRILTWTVAIIFLFSLGTSIHHVYFSRTDYYLPQMSRFREACVWIKEHTPTDALIISRKPRLAALWTDRKSWWYTDPKMIPDRDGQGNPMQVTHIIVTGFPIAGVNLGEGFGEVQSAHPDRFHLLYRTQSPTVSVYALRAP